MRQPSLVLLASKQVYSMNLELVARMAHVELTVSPPLLSALADFAHSSKVRMDPLPICSYAR